MKARLFAAATIFAVTACTSPLFAQRLQEDKARDRESYGELVRRTLSDTAAEFWLYEDVPAGFAESRRTGKPLLVSIR